MKCFWILCSDCPSQIISTTGGLLNNIISIPGQLVGTVTSSIGSVANVAGNTIGIVANTAGQTVQGIASSATNLLSSPVVIIEIGIVLVILLKKKVKTHSLGNKAIRKVKKGVT